MNVRALVASEQSLPTAHNLPSPHTTTMHSVCATTNVRRPLHTIVTPSYNT